MKCKKCKTEKPENEFSLNGRFRVDGSAMRQCRCKDCKKIEHAEWREKNKAKEKEYRKLYYKENRAEACMAAHRQRARNPEGCRAVTRQWQKEHRFHVALHSSRAAAKRFDHLPCLATPEELEAAFTGKCHACGLAEEDHGRKLCIDHDHETGEFRGWLCHSCNTADVFAVV